MAQLKSKELIKTLKEAGRKEGGKPPFYKKPIWLCAIGYVLLGIVMFVCFRSLAPSVFAALITSYVSVGAILSTAFINGYMMEQNRIQSLEDKLYEKKTVAYEEIFQPLFNMTLLADYFLKLDDEIKAEAVNQMIKFQNEFVNAFSKYIVILNPDILKQMDIVMNNFRSVLGFLDGILDGKEVAISDTEYEKKTLRLKSNVNALNIALRYDLGIPALDKSISEFTKNLSK
jgi:hypothetical protein